MTVDITKLAAPFPPEKVHWRVGSTTQDKKKGMALAYIDARDVMERLDEVCGPENWQRRYVDAGNGRTCCEIGIRLNDWVWKADGAGDTDFEGDKGAFSDAFKRAAVNWGIGRYLYDLDSPWVPIEQRGKSFIIADSAKPMLARALGGVRQQAPAPAKPSDPDKRKAYMDGARQAIKAFKNVNGCRTWWKNEAGHRKTAGLTDADIQELLDLISERFPAQQEAAE